MRRALLTGFLACAFSAACFAQTPMDIGSAKLLTRPDTAAPCAYTPTEKENPFYNRLAADERVTGSAFSKPYRIQGRGGQFVSWFGIVRGISRPQPDSSSLTLLLEHKYFDGVTDEHIMVVSAKGSGDFRATLTGDPKSIPALALVRVYGKVVDESDDVPRIAVEYLRVWPWHAFTLSNLGPEDYSNPRWADYCVLCKAGDLYNPYPTEDYYLQVFGDPNDFGLHLENTK